MGRATDAPDRLGALLRLTRDDRLRAWTIQLATMGALGWLGAKLVQTTLENLERRGIRTGWSFLSSEAGFGISETLPVPTFGDPRRIALVLAAVVALVVARIHRDRRRTGSIDGGRLALLALGALFLGLIVTPGTLRWHRYSEASSYAMALATGLANTFKVSVLGCLLATLLGLAVGLARRSRTWLLSRLAGVYIETLRNIPLLVQLFFWYLVVLRALPSPRESITFGPGLVLNNRGLFLPAPHPTATTWWVLAVVLTSALLLRLMGRADEKGGRWVGTGGARWIVALATFLFLVALPFVVDQPLITVERPRLMGFNYRGGLALSPEFSALLGGLTLYTAAFVAEIVRSGIDAVPRGQIEAALALGLRRHQIMRLVVLPQALRVIVPPLTSQYLNLTKNSSLGVAIGYPELVSVGGTILNQSGQAIEVIALTMAVYLALSLAISALMNAYEARQRWRLG